VGRDPSKEISLHVLVAYASRHGATQGIAERIAQVLQDGGVTAEALPAASVKSVAAYDAFVVGSAAYMFHWEKAAVAFVRRNRALLAAKPV
jgi:menaquinone-dependent protoporphyrinogen oxidase